MQYLKTISCKMPVLLIATVMMATVTLFYGCGENIPEQKEPTVPRDSTNALVIADTVIYDVIVKNPVEGDEWTEECLRNLKREGLVDIIFDAIYQKELIPYDYLSEEPLTLNAIKDLENDPEFKRENIGKIQFSEEWYFDKENLRMEKRVNSLSLGYEVFDLSGNLKGYKPAFMVKLN
ncbi:MAG: hypothetical protein ACLFQA_03530 [Bacteroidales bacterium]